MNQTPARNISYGAYGLFLSPNARQALMGVHREALSWPRPAHLERHKLVIVPSRLLPAQFDLPPEFRMYAVVPSYDPNDEVRLDVVTLTPPESDAITEFNFGGRVFDTAAVEVGLRGGQSVLTQLDVLKPELYEGQEGELQVVENRRYEPFLNDREATLGMLAETGMNYGLRDGVVLVETASAHRGGPERY